MMLTVALGMVLLVGILLPIMGNGMLPWRAGAVSLLLYTVWVQVNGLVVKSWGRYMLVATICWVGLVVFSLLLAHWLSKSPNDELHGIKDTYAILIVFYILLTFLAGVFRIAHMVLKGNEDL